MSSRDAFGRPTDPTDTDPAPAAAPAAEIRPVDAGVAAPETRSDAVDATTESRPARAVDASAGPAVGAGPAAPQGPGLPSWLLPMFVVDAVILVVVVVVFIL